MNKFDPDALVSTMSIREYAEIQFITGLLSDSAPFDNIGWDKEQMILYAEACVDIWIKNKQKGANNVK